MRSMMAVVLVLATMGQAAAIECPISHALYQQPDNGWSLRFMPVPEDGAPNQIAAFEITMPGAPETVLDGAIYIPNGFGQPHGFVTLDPEENSDADPFWEGVVYALIDGGIAEFPHDDAEPRVETMSPQQILLPQFGASVWYSMLRESAFADDQTVFDTFALATCVK
jgi:hypothetical protein